MTRGTQPLQTVNTNGATVWGHMPPLLSFPHTPTTLHSPLPASLSHSDLRHTPSLPLFLSLFHSTLLSAGHNSQKENRHSSAFSIGSSEFQQNKRADSLCEVISPGTNQHRSPAWCPPSPHPLLAPDTQYTFPFKLLLQ